MKQAEYTRRYLLVIANSKTAVPVHYIVAPTTFSVLEYLQGRDYALYADIATHTKIPLNTLYVFVDRLYRHGLVNKRMEIVASRKRTVLVLAQDVCLTTPTFMVR